MTAFQKAWLLVWGAAIIAIGVAFNPPLCVAGAFLILLATFS